MFAKCIVWALNIYGWWWYLVDIWIRATDCRCLCKKLLVGAFLCRVAFSSLCLPGFPPIVPVHAVWLIGDSMLPTLTLQKYKELMDWYKVSHRHNISVKPFTDPPPSILVIQYMNNSGHTVYYVSWYKPPDRIDSEQTMTTPVKAKQRKGKYLLWGRPAPAHREIQVSRFLMREIISIVQQYFLSSFSLFFSGLLTRLSCFLNSWPTYNPCLHLSSAKSAKHKPGAPHDKTTKITYYPNR